MGRLVLVSEYRGDVHENIHQDSVCDINRNKEEILEKGDVNHLTLYRPDMKPLQEIPVFKTYVIE